MATHHSPVIPRDGLICCLDPMNHRSWPSGSSTLYDVSGNGTNVVNATTSTSSSFVTYNGITVFRIGSGSLHPISNMNLQFPYTVICVCRYNSLGTNLRGRVLQSNSLNWLTGLHGGNVAFYANGWVSSQSLPSTGWFFTHATSDASDNHTFFVNNQDYTNFPNGGASAPTTLQIGSGWVTNEYSNADIGLILIYNRVLVAKERDLVYQMHKRRFGLT